MDRPERTVRNRAIPLVLGIIGIIVLYTIIHFVFIVDEVEDNVVGETPEEQLKE